jgi:hypothetical protein
MPKGPAAAPGLGCPGSREMRLGLGVPLSERGPIRTANVAGVAPGIGARPRDYGSGTILCARAGTWRGSPGDLRVRGNELWRQVAEPVGQRDLFVERFDEDQVIVAGVLDVVAAVAPDQADIADRKSVVLACGPVLNTVLPVVGVRVPVQLPHAARLDDDQGARQPSWTLGISCCPRPGPPRDHPVRHRGRPTGFAMERRRIPPGPPGNSSPARRAACARTSPSRATCCSRARVGGDNCAVAPEGVPLTGYRDVSSSVSGWARR